MTTATTMATTKTFLTAAGSLAASVVLARTIANDLVPDEVRYYIYDALAGFFARFSRDLTVVIEEFDGALTTNQMYRAAETYLGTKVSPSTRRLRVVKHDDDDGLDIAMERGEEVVDVFQGIQFKWRKISRETNQTAIFPRRRRGRSFYYDTATATEIRSFTLTFRKKHKDAALKSYLPHVLEQSKAIKDEAKTLKLYTNEDDSWNPVNLRHPATFATLAMDGEQKREIMEDLARFVRRKEYYKRIGKAWKRGYLLYGPPGTGKSSLVAAMANFLRFDVYDLELSEVRSNSALRSLLVGTANRSILVVEDIDCSVDLLNREKEKGSRDKQKSSSPDDEKEKVTLSGLLNFVDGLWSSCGDERIIVFTTNYKDRIDPALLRPGRMDMHIRMGFCSPTAFRMLAKNYHGMDEHPLFGEIEGLIDEVEVSPAEVAEELMRSEDAETALRGIVKLLQRKKKEASEAEAKAKGGDGEEQSEGQEIGREGVEQEELERR